MLIHIKVFALLGFFFCSPGGFGQCQENSVVSFTVGVGVKDFVTVHTQSLDTGGAVRLDDRDTTEATGLLKG